MNEDAARTQIRYLKDTPKPRKMTVREWIMRVRSINAYLNIMQISGNQDIKMSDADLVREVIYPNILEAWISKWEMMSRTNTFTSSEAIRKLEVIELEEKREGYKNKSEKAKGNNNERKKKVRRTM